MNLSAGLASVAVAFVLVGLKLWALGTTQSLSVAASLTDSALDLMMSLGGLMAILYAARPADEDHAFGHTSIEDLAALGQALFILASAAVIGWAAVTRLLSPEARALSAETGGMIVMGLSIGAIAALWMSARFGLGQVDSVVALGAALMLAVGSVRIGKGAWDALMDRRADPKVIEGIAAIARAWPGVRGFHDLKTRTAGSRVFVNIHIELDGDQSLRDAHAIGAGLRRRILETYPQCDVIVHKDVAGGG
jgi:ferrous-iron efflux pump FieF